MRHKDPTANRVKAMLTYPERLSLLFHIAAGKGWAIYLRNAMTILTYNPYDLWGDVSLTAAALDDDAEYEWAKEYETTTEALKSLWRILI